LECGTLHTGEFESARKIFTEFFAAGEFARDEEATIEATVFRPNYAEQTPLRIEEAGAVGNI